MTKNSILAGALCTLLVLPMHSFAEEFESEDDRLSYSLGVLIGEQLKRDFDNLNLEQLFNAIRTKNEGGEPLLSLQDASLTVQAHHTKKQQEQQVAALAASQEYLQNNALRKEVTITESGLQYEVLEATDGPQPNATDTVKVHYRGTLTDGTEFDSSYSRNAPAEFPLNRVIPGWTEGVQLMNVGSKFRFVIPANLAYGDRGSPPTIPGGATLVFEVELLEIVAAE